MAIVVAPGKAFAPIAPVADTVFGDSAGTFYGSARNQSFVYAGTAAASVFGDADALARTAVGGRDSFVAKGQGSLFGDAGTLSGSARGGNDTIDAKSIAGGLTVYGDGYTLADRALGGNDTIRTHGAVQLYGDGYQLGSSARGGNDVITAK
ncbi:MAG: hypothetical protein AB7X49_20735, partial [Geminicoccaceae bacterium]